MEKEILKEKSKEEQKEKIKEKKAEVKKDEKKENNNKETEFKKVDKNTKKLEKEMYKENYKKNINKKKKRIILCVVIIAILLVLSTIFAVLNLNNNKIISGISISGVDVSGLSKNEAVEKIKSIYNSKIEKDIGLKYQDYEATLSPSLLEVNYDIEKAVDEAYLIGRDNNIILNNYNIITTLIGKKNILVDMSLNEEVAKQSLEDIGVNLPGIIIESTYSVEDDELLITKGKEGICVDADELLNKVKERLSDINSNDDDIEISVKSKKPEEIDIEKIHSEVYKEAKDAYYTKDPFEVHPEVEGIDFDVEAAKKILEEEKEEYVIPLTITKPKVTLNDIGSEAFPDKLATFTTRYDASDKDRTANLIIACRKINGKVVLADETFSYNKALGARTAQAGYKNAKVYENGEVVDGIGGGICQISSTLYNSVLMSNLKIVERRNHQFVTSYVPAGRDATVVYGMTDFKFKNTRKYPIRIIASAQNGIATVSIYGIKEENEYTFTFSTRTVASIPFTTKYVEDSTLPAGTEKVKQKGANGLKTETYITKMLNGKVISTELLSKDTYDAMTRIILKSTKTETQAPVNNQPSDENVNNKPASSNENNNTNTSGKDNTDSSSNTGEESGSTKDPDVTQ